MKIAVLMGGNSEEREVSLASGVQVCAALRRAGHEVVPYDTTRGVLAPEVEASIRQSGVGRLPPVVEGRDLLDTADTAALSRAPGVADADLFFLALHGGMGEDGTLQALLDVLGTPYTGSGRIGCALAMDKDLTKRLLRDAGIPTAEWIADPGPGPGEDPPPGGTPDPDEVIERLGLPVIVKAAGGGSSLRLVLAHDRDELESASRESRGFGDTVIYERYVRGRELTVGILGGEALPVGEIVPEHELFDYECKYQPGMAREIFPADLPDAVAGLVRERALDVHRTLRLEGYSRVDFILDDDGEAWCLEANALPGMTANSLVPKAAGAAGVSFSELCDRIATLALRRRSPSRRG